MRRQRDSDASPSRCAAFTPVLAFHAQRCSARQRGFTRVPVAISAGETSVATTPPPADKNRDVNSAVFDDSYFSWRRQARNADDFVHAGARGNNPTIQQLNLTLITVAFTQAGFIQPAIR
ncbi:hypothetical protein JGY85_00510 [Shigella sonnei]|nr:hypothetical protein [Shigella sonnei]